MTTRLESLAETPPVPVASPSAPLPECPERAAADRAWAEYVACQAECATQEALLATLGDELPAAKFQADSRLLELLAAGVPEPAAVQQADTGRVRRIEAEVSRAKHLLETHPERLAQRLAAYDAARQRCAEAVAARLTASLEQCFAEALTTPLGRLGPLRPQFVAIWEEASRWRGARGFKGERLPPLNPENPFPSVTALLRWFLVTRPSRFDV